MYWIHIEYVGSLSEAGAFRKKEDGLFAMRTKAGEKAERIVARKLKVDFGHSFSDPMLNSPGFFQIHYADKKDRKPDRICRRCGLTFEVKKRNRDSHYRMSHSVKRPFGSENHPEGWHAFVFRDRSIHFVPNATIAQAIADGAPNTIRTCMTIGRT
ncbi:MAG: hypothetical protein PPHEMADM_5339 [uncultured Paraburkholderia sp.]|nr:MAG: hypothetical protein PPHEMADE_5330 [uncultured Paraburkholderia sp.]CAH2944140.1 MAG: hypothetical protein PPHEMADM_5339 [uncultured Paraburkholderia sp.]